MQKLLQIQISKPKYTEVLLLLSVLLSLSPTTHKAQLHQNHNLSAKPSMQENPDKKTPKPNSKWQQKFTHAPHLPTQGDLSLRKETLGSPARCTDMISYTLSIFQNNKSFVFD
jgi:hypothetical protein